MVQFNESLEHRIVKRDVESFVPQAPAATTAGVAPVALPTNAFEVVDGAIVVSEDPYIP